MQRRPPSPQPVAIPDRHTRPIATADSGSVIKGADNHNGASVGGSQTTTTVTGTGTSTAADGHESTTTTVTSTTTTTTDSSDNSVQETVITDTSTHDYSDHSLFDTNLMSNNDTSLDSNPAFASGNHLLGLGF